MRDKGEKGSKCISVVRVRGISDVWYEIKDTLKMLNLPRNCYATLIDDRPSYIGMLRKAQNYITWGEVSRDTILLLLRKRGRTLGDKPLTDEYAKSVGYNSLEDLADAIYRLEVEFKKLPNIKPFFRLHPPRGGYRGSVKKSFQAGGVTGYRGEAINDLIKRMA